MAMASKYGSTTFSKSSATVEEQTPVGGCDDDSTDADQQKHQPKNATGLAATEDIHQPKSGMDQYTLSPAALRELAKGFPSVITFTTKKASEIFPPDQIAKIYNNYQRLCEIRRASEEAEKQGGSRSEIENGPFMKTFVVDTTISKRSKQHDT